MRKAGIQVHGREYKRKISFLPISIRNSKIDYSFSTTEVSINCCNSCLKDNALVFSVLNMVDNNNNCNF